MCWCECYAGQEEHDEILALTATKPDCVPWRNATPPQSLLNSRSYKPHTHATAIRDLGTPALFVAAELDRVTPAQQIQEVAAVCGPHAQFFKVPGQGHSKIYFDPWKSRLAQLETDFLARHLLPLADVSNVGTGTGTGTDTGTRTAPQTWLRSSITVV